MIDPNDFEPGEWKDVSPIGGMATWCCSYDGPGGRRMGIELAGIDPNQILEDHCGDFPGLVVDGELVCVAPAVPRKDNT